MALLVKHWESPVCSRLILRHLPPLRSQFNSRNHNLRKIQSCSTVTCRVTISNQVKPSRRRERRNKNKIRVKAKQSKNILREIKLLRCLRPQRNENSVRSGRISIDFQVSSCYCCYCVLSSTSKYASILEAYSCVFFPNKPMLHRRSLWRLRFEMHSMSSGDVGTEIVWSFLRLFYLKKKHL